MHRFIFVAILIVAIVLLVAAAFVAARRCRLKNGKKRALLTPLGRRNESASKMIMARFQFYTY
jgi:hypothetical protein